MSKYRCDSRGTTSSDCPADDEPFKVTSYPHCGSDKCNLCDMGDDCSYIMCEDHG